jgi:hypothetical protein
VARQYVRVGADGQEVIVVVGARVPEARLAVTMDGDEGRVARLA